MSDIIIKTTVSVGGTSLITKNRMFTLKRNDCCELGDFTLNELIDMGKAIDAMVKEMGKVDLTDSRNLFDDKSWGKV